VIACADSALVAALHPSPNIEPRRGVDRPDMLILHYTGMTSCAGAIDWLARPESRVSCHYVVDVDGRITQMVAEAARAWHAGVAQWAGTSDINSRSIGIEIQNPGHDHGYPEFPPAQMAAVIGLCRDIIARQPIPRRNVLAHSDVAPERKNDPGEKFPWRELFAAGIGHWVEPVAIAPDDPGLAVGAQGPAVAGVQHALAAYGYGVPASGTLDLRTSQVLTAFQRHFRPERVDGRLDRSTVDTLAALLGALAAS
jgi:N-acetylmuramoyl-L-alanine amidase